MTEKNVLVIDDDDLVREMLVHLLEKNGIRCTAVSSGSEALAAISRQIPNLIISDLLLPGEHGLDVIERITRNYFIPVIVLSGVYSREDISAEMEEKNIRFYFEKPPDLEKLVSAVQELLDERSL